MKDDNLIMTRQKGETDLVVDKMFFIGSESHEYICPRGTSQKLAAHHCCSCPAVGLESSGHVEIAAFCSAWSPTSVDVLCEGIVVHSFWYPEDTVSTLKVIPLNTRMPELYAEEGVLVVGLALLVATLNGGLLVYCVGLRATTTEGR